MKAKYKFMISALFFLVLLWAGSTTAAISQQQNDQFHTNCCDISHRHNCSDVPLGPPGSGTGGGTGGGGTGGDQLVYLPVSIDLPVTYIIL